MKKVFKKSKKPYFGTSLDTLGKNEFSWEKGLCQILDIPIIYHRAKNQKKLLSHFWEKRRTNGRTDRQTDKRWFYRISVGGPIIKFVNLFIINLTWSSAFWKHYSKGALKSYFWHCSCAVIILFNTSLYGSIFSGYFLKTSFLPVCIFCFLCFSFDVIFLEFIQVFVLKLFLNVLGALWFCSHVLKLTL